MNQTIDLYCLLNTGKKNQSYRSFCKSGKICEEYAYKDITFEFSFWVSSYFKFYLIKEFERLKKEEQKQLG